MYMDDDYINRIISKDLQRIKLDNIKPPYCVPDNPAVRLVFNIFEKYSSVYDFMCRQDYYKNFKLHTKVSGIHPSFDKPGITLSFIIKAGKIQFKVKLNRIRQLKEELLFLQNLKKQSINNSVQSEEKTARHRENNFVKKILETFKIMLLNYISKDPQFIYRIEEFYNQNKYYKMIDMLIELYRDRMASLIKEKFPEGNIKIYLDRILAGKTNKLNKILNAFEMIDNGKGKRNLKYKLVISPGDKLELFRGNISCDCTAFKQGPSFFETIPQHLLDPGFINMRLFESNKWVGNVYLLVAEVNKEPALIIDAIQTSIIHDWFIPEVMVAERIIKIIKKYAKKYGFKKVYLSNFTSNRAKIHIHFRTYPHIKVHLHKTGEFEHLKQLNLWNDQKFRNEYIETLSCGSYNLEEQSIILIEIQAS